MRWGRWEHYCHILVSIANNLHFGCSMCYLLLFPFHKRKNREGDILIVWFLQVSFSGVMHSSAYSQDDIPKSLVRTLSQGSNVMSMDFHPQQQTILLGLWVVTKYVTEKTILWNHLLKFSLLLQLAQMLVTLAFGKLGRGRGWYINLSRFGIYRLLPCHCRYLCSVLYELFLNFFKFSFKVNKLLYVLGFFHS